jgi:hypothetical protein
LCIHREIDLFVVLSSRVTLNADVLRGVTKMRHIYFHTLFCAANCQIVSSCGPRNTVRTPGAAVIFAARCLARAKKCKRRAKAQELHYTTAQQAQQHEALGFDAGVSSVTHTHALVAWTDLSRFLFSLLYLFALSLFPRLSPLLST